MALAKEYFKLTENYKKEYGEKTIILMQVGAFFEVYAIKHKDTECYSGSNIVEFSSICGDLAIANKKICVGTNNLVMSGFRDYQLDKYLHRLDESGYTTVVYTQDTQTSNTTRSLDCIYSPGTYFSLNTEKISNHIAAIWINRYNYRKVTNLIIGIADIDIYTGKVAIFEYNIEYFHNPTTFNNLEQFINIYMPSEIIVIHNLEDAIIDDIINYAGISSKLVHRVSIYDENGSIKKQNQIGSFNIQKQACDECPDLTNMQKKAYKCERQIYQQEILNQYFNNYESQMYMENTIATQALCFILDFIAERNPNLIYKLSEPVFENHSDRLVLANHSLRQLNILEDHNYNGKLSSVLKFLNKCVTPMGKRQFKYNFVNPTTNIQTLSHEYDIIEYILENYEENTYIRENLERIKDIEKINRKIILKNITQCEIWNFYKMITEIRQMTTLISKNHYLSDYFKKTVGDSNYSKTINNHCNSILEFLDKTINYYNNVDESYQPYNFFKQGVYTELDDKVHCYLDSFNLYNAIRNFFDSKLAAFEKQKKQKKQSSSYVKIHSTEKSPSTLQMTRRRSSILKNQLKLDTENIIYLSDYTKTQKQFELDCKNISYTFLKETCVLQSTQLQKIAGDIFVLKDGLAEVIDTVYKDFLKQLNAYQHNIQQISEFIMCLDMLQAKAKIAKDYNYCKPEVVYSKKSFVDAHGLRHVLIEQLQTNEIYVANDIYLGVETENTENTEMPRGILLYGTNAVGKTSLIRALGISVIMAQAGLFVPCRAFRFYPYKYIFTRILGNDNLFKGLSTFAVEMSELRMILNHANDSSLILGDELCSGTETSSAVSIFVAGLQELYSRESSFIFATHFHEIVKYDEICNMNALHMKHLSVFFDREKDKLIYDRILKDGSGESMYGLEVCKSLHLPDIFLTRAYDLRIKYNKESSGILGFGTSRYNSKQIVGICDICKTTLGTEVHHLQYQSQADNNNYINGFHKNHVANLATICKECHVGIHQENKQYKRVKTSDGYELVVI